MSGTVQLLLFIVFLAIAVFCGQKFNLNVGLSAMIFAFILGCFFGDLTPSTVAGLFPNGVYMIQLTAVVFFSFLNMTGVFNVLAKKIVYLFRNAAWALPFAIFFATIVVVAAGASGISGPVLMSPIAFSIAAAVDMPVIMVPTAIYFGFTWAAILPWTGGGANQRSIASQFIGEQYASDAVAVGRTSFLVLAIMVFFVVYFFTKCYKLKGSANMEKPEAFNADQKKALSLVVIFIAFLILPKLISQFAPNTVCSWIMKHCDVQSLSMLFTLVCILMGLGGKNAAQEVLTKKVPWGLLVMITGMSLYMQVGSKMGIVDTLAGFISSGISEHWIPFVLCTIATLLSFVSSGVVIGPLIYSLAASLAGADPRLLIMFGGCGTGGPGPSGVCQISGGGAAAVTGATAEQREVLFKQQFIVAFVALGINMILTACGLYQFVYNIIIG